LNHLLRNERDGVEVSGSPLDVATIRMLDEKLGHKLLASHICSDSVVQLCTATVASSQNVDAMPKNIAKPV
jgi:hypothetical protein